MHISHIQEGMTLTLSGACRRSGLILQKTAPRMPEVCEPHLKKLCLHVQSDLSPLCSVSRGKSVPSHLPCALSTEFAHNLR